MENIKAQAKKAATELIENSKLEQGDVVVVGCSSSEVMGFGFGSQSSAEVGKAVFDGIYEALSARGIYLAAQCCEHLNRAVVTERALAGGREKVSVIPQLKAGGAFATAAYTAFSDPVVLEEIKADAGLDIGGTLIGMHLKAVAVPLKLQTKTIGEAIILAARTRPKFIGGSRAVYDENLL